MLWGGIIGVWLSSVADPSPTTRPEKKLPVVERRLINLPRPARFITLTIVHPTIPPCHNG